MRSVVILLFSCVAVLVACRFVNADPPSSEVGDVERSETALKSLKKFLDISPADRGALGQQDFAAVPLTKKDAEEARDALSRDRLERIRRDRVAEMKSQLLTQAEHEMPFFSRRFGDKPDEGHSLYISLHGGGGTTPTVNDRQWENQKRLYKLQEGIYVAPRAPTNTWDLWHQGHIDQLFRRLIENMVAFEHVDWNRVYVMGYSAGGDGVYQLAPRMADAWAAAAMMAGHPNETSPIGLRNVPFVLQVGERDAAYKRNKIAAQWQEQLAKLRGDDPGGYEHFVKIHAGKGHWMDREDAVAIPWMAKHTRNPTPSRIVWKQDNVTHSQFYWLGVDDENRKQGTEIVADVQGQTISVSADGVDRVIVYVDDRFIDLEKPVTIRVGEESVFAGVVSRTITTLSKTLETRGDPFLSFPGSIEVAIP